VLLVDDSGDAALTRRALDACTNPSFLVDEATSLPDAAEQLQASSYHVVLLVLGMNESAGIERVTQYGACCADPPPLIVLTSLDDEEAALQMLDRGVQDYLVKSDVRPHTLSRSIRYALPRMNCCDPRTSGSANCMTRPSNSSITSPTSFAPP
jgi:DNA-binding response OmpR family regulator